MCPIHADFKHFLRQSGRFSFGRQGLVNHAGEWARSDLRLTSLIKAIRKLIWQSPRIDREHNPGGEIKP